MTIFRFAAGFGLVTVLGFSIASAQGLNCRNKVSSSIQAVCSGDGSACINAIKQQLATAKDAGCGGSGICIAQGLADATSAINARNPILATSMAEAVAVNGAQCLQVAYGAVLDGSGIAAIQDEPPEAGSRG